MPSPCVATTASALPRIKKAGAITFVVGILDFIGRAEVVRELLTQTLGIHVAGALTTWWVPWFLMLVGVFVLVFLRKTQSEVLWKNIGLGLAMAVIVFALALGVAYFTTPHFIVETECPCGIGNVLELPHPSTSLFVRKIVLRNSGSASITYDWKASVALDDGEVLIGSPSPKGYGGPTGPSVVYKVSDTIYAKSASTPVSRGASEQGYGDFDFVGIPQVTLSKPGTKFVISFKDVAGKSYSVDYKLPAHVREGNPPF